MHIRARLATPIAVGLGLGLLVGLVESLLLLGEARFMRNIGYLALFSVVGWGLIGALVGGASAIFPPRGSRDRAEVFATAAARVGSTLILVLLVAQSHVGGVSGWQCLVDHLPALVAVVAVWLLSPRISRNGPMRVVLSGAARAWPIWGMVALIGASLLTGLGLGQPVALTVFEAKAGEHSTPAAEPARLPELMVLGVDAATWDIVMPLVESGRMPHLRRLMERGTWGTLRSTPRSFSPVVWTSIMTGVKPDKHGVSMWATERRVKSIWEIATDAGKQSAVINVPGTYPVLGDCGFMMSGMPIPERGNLNNLGWLLTTRASRLSEGGLPVLRLDVDPQEIAAGESRSVQVELRDRPRSGPVGRSAPSQVLRALFGHHAVDHLEIPLARVGFGTIDLTVIRDSSGCLVVEGRQEEHEEGGGDRLFALGEGEWSDPLVAEIDGIRFSFSIYRIGGENGEVELFVTPLFTFPGAGFAHPADEISDLLISPYIAEGVGWTVSRHDGLLRPLREHLMDVEASRQDLGLSVLGRIDMDLFVFVYTVTDRMSHGMMKFMYPEQYQRYAAEEGGDYERYKPTAQQIAEFGDAITECYVQVDAWIGEMLQRVGPETAVAICSDHGSGAGVHSLEPTAGVHRRNGIYILAPAGADVGSTHSASDLETTHGPELILEDMTPAFLYLLGLPAADDMGGKLPAFLISDGDSVPTVPTYEDAGAARRAREAHRQQR